MFSRFLKYVKTIARNKRASIRCLYGIVKDDVKSITGSNIRTIMKETGTDPRLMKLHGLKNWRVYPQTDSWTVPLLKNLLEICANNWEVMYDDETGDMANEDEIEFTISAICTG